jgi:hypothetical protein
MGQTVGPETLVSNLNQMPGNYPKEDNFNKTLFFVTAAFQRHLAAMCLEGTSLS